MFLAPTTAQGGSQHSWAHCKGKEGRLRVSRMQCWALGVSHSFPALVHVVCTSGAGTCPRSHHRPNPSHIFHLLYSWQICEAAVSNCFYGPHAVTKQGQQQQQSLGEGSFNTVVFHFPVAAAAAAKSLQSCPTLCDPIDGSPPANPCPLSR